MNDELFKVEVNEEGAQTLRRFARLAQFILVVTLVLGGLQVASTLYLFLKSPAFSTADKHFTRQYYFLVAGVVLGFMLQAVQVILYWRFAVQVVRSIADSNTALFNHSFKLLYIQAVCFLLHTAFTFLFLISRFFFR